MLFRSARVKRRFEGRSALVLVAFPSYSDKVFRSFAVRNSVEWPVVERSKPIALEDAKEIPKKYQCYLQDKGKGVNYRYSRLQLLQIRHLKELKLNRRTHFKDSWDPCLSLSL